MIDNNVSLDLMEFVETQILPRYSAFDAAHRIAHANHVIKSSIELARMLGADVNMAYAIAAYHDLGLEGPRAIHHLTSGKILASDRRLLRWFTPSQLQVMKEAVEDHRSSFGSQGRPMSESWPACATTSPIPLCSDNCLTGFLRNWRAKSNYWMVYYFFCSILMDGPSFSSTSSKLK